MKYDRFRGSTSNMVRVFIPDNTSVKGAGKTGLTNASTNLTIAYMRELDSASTVYTGANIEAQTTIGTFQAPSTSAKCRFKEVDATNFPGVYEIQFHDTATIFGTGDASRNVQINIFEATTTALNIGPNMSEIRLIAWNMQTASIPDVIAGAAGGIFIAGVNAPVTITGSGNALTLTSTGANGHGLVATGNGSGDGIHGVGGATGDGIEGDGGASGNGIHALGGATNGAGLRAEAAGSNSAGLKALGFGSGAGLDGVGGATGPGAKFSGGATSGDGVTAIATGVASNGITATGIGTGDGLNVAGGAGADGDGVHATAGGGVDIKGNITGNVTGNLSGSVNSVTTGVTLATAAILAIWNQLTGDVGIVANTFGAKLRDWVLGTDNKALISTDAQATVYNAIADALLKRDWTAVTGEASRSVLNALRKLRNKVSFDGVNTLTITKENDVATAFTQTVVEDAAQTPFKSVG